MPCSSRYLRRRWHWEKPPVDGPLAGRREGSALVHLTLAIADFMRILITAALYAAASAGGLVLLGIAALGGMVWGVRRAFGGRRGE